MLAGIKENHDSASDLGEVNGTRRSLLPQGTVKLDKYTKQYFSKYQTMKDTNPRETENKWDEPC